MTSSKHCCLVGTKMRPAQALAVLLLILLASGTALAQPNPYGCHYFHHHAGPVAPPMGPAERDVISETIARSDTFDILDYDIHIDVTDFWGRTIKARTTVTYKALLADQAFIRFDLWDLQVDSVVGLDGLMPFDYDGRYLRVDFATPPPVGEERALTVHYRGSPRRDPQWGGFYFVPDYIFTLGIGISTIPPNFGKVWYPCFDSFVERATYTFHVKSAGTFRFHGQGVFLGETQLAGDTVIRGYRLDQAIPTHICAIAVADYETHEYTHSGAYRDIPVTLKARPPHLAAMVSRFGDLPAAIDACEHWYGPYAYDRVGYVITTDGAMEIPTNVAYPQHMTGASVLNNRGLYSHELGHHWWGNIVTPYVHNEMWLKEGPAEYTDHLVEERVGGKAGLERAIKNNLVFILRQAHINDGGFQPLSPMPDARIYGTHTYYKGAAVMHNLRGYLGDTLFRQAMRGVQQQYPHTTITSDGFRQALEEQVPGVDLRPFFDAWVFAPGYSAFEVRNADVTPNAGNWDVEVTVGQKLYGATVPHQQVPLDLTFVAADGTAHEERIVASGETTRVTLSAPFEPAMVILNRHARLNLARMDLEVVVRPDQPLESILPYVEFRVFKETVTDSMLLRVEHLWVPPDQAPLGQDIIAISGTHYWNVDGLWPEGNTLRGRLFYYGATATQLDHGLIAGNEAGICVVYRASPDDPWEVYADQVVNAGNLTNGTGYIDLNGLRRGQYAFAKISGNVGIGDGDWPVRTGIELHPVPANNSLTVVGMAEEPSTLVMDVHGLDGRLLQRRTASAFGEFRETMDVSALPVGAYLLRVVTTLGRDIGTSRFEVVR